MTDSTTNHTLPTTTSAGGMRSAPRNAGKTYRQQMQLSEAEYAGLQAMKGALMLHVGRPVSLTLALRLAVYLLAAQCQRSLTDPALAARLKANLLAVRKARPDNLS
jgi:hypothetical protein